MADIRNTYWREYWATKESGGHRFNTEEFLRKEAREKIFHLDGGETLLDFGCGSSDILIHYLPIYEEVIGVDFSPRMLDMSRLRLRNIERKNYTFIEADNETVWDKIGMKRVDRISLSQVVQYFDAEQLESFLQEAKEHLNDGGKIVLFDIIDSRLLGLFEIGIFRSDLTRIDIQKMKILRKCYRIFRKIKNQTGSDLGFSYKPSQIAEIANRYGLKTEYVCAMYYEYRFHMILEKKGSLQP